MEAVCERVKYADRNIDFTIRKGKRYFRTLDGYLNSYLPRIFRMSWSDTRDHGLIIAINNQKNAQYSGISLFYDWDKLKEYIKRTQASDSEFYIVGRQPYAGFFEEMGCLNAFELPRELRNISPLQKAVRDRQSAGSHEAYTAKVKREITQINYGRSDDSGDDPSPDDFD